MNIENHQLDLICPKVPHIGIFLAMAVNLAVAAKAESITIGCNKADESVFPDCRMAFIQAFNNLLTVAEIGVEVCAPYIDKSKAWIAAHGQEIGVRMDQTWSCYQGGDVPCGECLACQTRNEALK